MNDVTLTQVAQLYGAPTHDIPLSAFYRGADYVPDTPLYASIPTSGAISLSTLIIDTTAKRLVWTAQQDDLDVNIGTEVDVTLPEAELR